MPSTYTTNLGIEKIGTGEQSGTWGTTTNTNLDLIDQAVNGVVQVTLVAAGTSGSPNSLPINDGAASDGRNKFIEFTDGGDLGATAYVQLTPNDAKKVAFFRNSLTGGRSVILFQGTYNASNDFEIPSGADVVLKFDGAGAGATVTQVFEDLTISAVTLSSGVTASSILDEDNMASDSATALTTQQSIKAYVDSQVATVDTLAEILANGNTSGATNLVIDSGQVLTTNTINETTAASGVTIDSVLLKDDGVNATNLEITNLKANDGTSAGSIANNTGVVTLASSVLTTTDINGGTIDGTVIGGSTAAAGSFTTFTSTGIDDNATSTAITIDSGQRLLVGTTSFSYAGVDITVGSTSDAQNGIAIQTSTTGYGYVMFGDGTGADAFRGQIYYKHGDDFMAMLTAGAEAVRIDSSRNLLVAGTTTNPVGSNVVGHALSSDGRVQHSITGNTVMKTNQTTNGDIVQFRINGTPVGSIGTLNTDLYVGSGDCNLRFRAGQNEMTPATTNGSLSDGLLDLGANNARFKDLYLSGGVYLGGTAAANKLDDYEEGTWTPTLNSAGNTGFTSGAFKSTISTYVKIGRIVHIRLLVGFGSFNQPSAGSYFSIRGLPFNTRGSDTTASVLSGSGSIRTNGDSRVAHFLISDGQDSSDKVLFHCTYKTGTVYWSSEIEVCFSYETNS